MIQPTFYHPLPGGAELRVLEEPDAEALYQAVQLNRSHLSPWLPWAQGASLETSLSFIRAGQQQMARGEGFHAGLWWQGRLVGVVGFNRMRPLERRVEIGYWLDEALQGRGLMTAAVSAIIDHAFQVMRLHKVEIHCAVDNHRSRRIPERLGFTHEGTRRRAVWARGALADAVIYGLWADEWRSRKGAGG
ncbi:MAG TPA: GNAT family protein [Candidatus Nitrosotenuis sp.]|nr:GNAT family protein [Candidatus Nitrosotenuis sp.]